MALPPGFIDELRGRVSLAQVVGRKLTWDARKTNLAKGDYWAPCPFHQEKTASFHVDDRRGFYHCFGCEASGDAFKFLRETENIGFMEAVERLAREAGMTLPAQDPAAAARAAVQADLVEVMEMAVRFYRAQLTSAQAAAARAYLDRRGVAQATRARFELGFAGSGRTALFEHLRAKGVAAARIAEAGLCVQPDAGGGAPFDRFRDRILFPIRDARGRAIAFGGRAMAANAQAKYLNSPETPLFDKGRCLYNHGPARAAAGRTGALVVVEGYMDVIALAEAGVEHAVAPLGTAVTADQLALVWRMADEPVIALDGDAAGQKAARRVMDLALPLLAAGKGLRFALMPPGQDPDDVVRAGGRRAFDALIAGSRPMVDLIWERETEGAPLDSPERRAALDARLRVQLGRIGDPSIRAHYQAEIKARSAALFFPRRRQRQNSGPPDRRRRTDAPPQPRASTLASPLAQRHTATDADARVRESAILVGCLNHPDLAERFAERIDHADFLCRDLAELKNVLVSTLAEAAPGAELGSRIAARLGRDLLPGLLAAGPLRAEPHLRAGGDPEKAARAIAEALERHAAWTGRREEVRHGDPSEIDESTIWRICEANEAMRRADANALADAAAESNDESVLSEALQHLLDQPTSRKPAKR